MSVGRDGASDAVAFMAAGIPAVEFGPDGAGHHGPEEWASISSLARYRRSLVSFVRMLPIWLERPAPEVAAAEAGGVAAEEPRSGLTAIEGGRA
jgi:succinyl-diaminopimelate desuccinylase